MARSRSAAELRKTIPALLGVYGQSQADLGEAMGLTQGQVSRKIAGGSPFTLADCDAIAEHFGITTAQLLSGKRTAVAKSLAAKEKASGRGEDPAADMG